MKRAILLSLLLLSACTQHFDAATTAQSVVAIANETGGGTAFVVEAPSGRTYILTNAHVCEGLHLPAIEISHITDLCLLPDIFEGAFPAIKVAQYEPLPFDKVHVVGYGLLLGSTHTEGSYVGRIPTVLSVQRPAYCTASILPGNSGSPVLNEAGELVGVAYASAPVIDNRALMVPLEDIKAFLFIY